MGPAFEDLIALGRADITTKRTATRRRIIDKLAHLSERVRVMRQKMAAPKSTVPKGLGLAIIDELGITPGPRVGELRSMCLNAQLDGRLAEAPSIGECIAFLRAALAA